MAHIEKAYWWKAKEIPLIETDWRNIRAYCEQDDNPFDWYRCLYVVRLAPPFAITYGDDEKHELTSPLLYVGSGSIQQRWSSHREWLFELGRAIPGGRYEVWVCQPRCPNNSDVYADIEADILNWFDTRTNGFRYGIYAASTTRDTTLMKMVFSRRSYVTIEDTYGRYILRAAQSQKTITGDAILNNTH